MGAALAALHVDEFSSGFGACSDASSILDLPTDWLSFQDRSILTSVRYSGVPVMAASTKL